MSDLSTPHPESQPIAGRVPGPGRDARRPIVIAHRGASGYRPEHTLEAYRLAIRQGADFIEPDLVATRDGVLVARHDNELATTTDVAAHPEFAGRHATKTVDGVPVSGWFSEDFTLAEIRTLRCRERLPQLRPGNARFDGLYPIPTFAEVLQLARRESRDGRHVGVYPETKHPTYFAREGRHFDGSPVAVSLGALLVATLVAEGFTDPARVYIQSFEIENLIELKTRLMPAAGIALPLVQLLGRLEAAAPYDIGHNARRGADLAAIYGALVAHVDGGLDAGTRCAALGGAGALGWMRATYAAGIGPWKGDVVRAASPSRPIRPDSADDGDGNDGNDNFSGNGNGNGGTGSGRGGRRCDRRLTAKAMLGHALGAGLLVHPYTLRAESGFLLRDPSGATVSVVDEAMQLFSLGVQGIFIDQPDLGVAAREWFLGLQRLPGDA